MMRATEQQKLARSKGGGTDALTPVAGDHERMALSGVQEEKTAAIKRQAV